MRNYDIDKVTLLSRDVDPYEEKEVDDFMKEFDKDGKRIAPKYLQIVLCELCSHHPFMVEGGPTIL